MLKSVPALRLLTLARPLRNVRKAGDSFVVCLHSSSKNNMSISLNATEEQLCGFLDDFSKSLKQEKPEEPQVECRIAGGWVRDKLLGLHSDDLDVALSTMMGYPFAVAFQTYLKSNDVKFSIPKEVMKNPAKSKHLDTAKMTVLGLDIDFVNLRAEDYAEDSRVPVNQRFGTPVEDALRRDLTINALFFNIHTREVEDFTGQGLSDLAGKLCRTPLPPRQTFLDDPLRVPRAIRFASRFGFELDPELREAASSPEIRDALLTKVSRERVGIELEKMLKGPDPRLSVQLIHDLCLYSTIYHLIPAAASSLSASPLPEQTGMTAAYILHHLISSSDMQLPILERARNDAQVRKRLYLAAELTPYGHLTYVADKGKHIHATECVIRESLKLGNHDIASVNALFQAAQLISNPVLTRFASPDRVSIGILLRNPAVHNLVTGAHWADSTVFSLVQDLLPMWDSEGKTLKSGANQVIQVYTQFVERVSELDLPRAIEEKARLDGNEICTTLGIKQGPSLGLLLNAVIEWQLEHPEGSKDECKGWLKQAVEDGRIKVEAQPPKARQRDGESAPKKARRK